MTISKLCSYKRKLSCISCHLNCEILPECIAKFKVCPERKFSIWPDENNYLNEGVRALLHQLHYNNTGNDVIFVNFSYHNMKLFSNSSWLDYLSASRSDLIPIADKKMESLANYWRKISFKIRTIIYSNDSYHHIEEKVELALSGRKMFETRRRKLTKTEMLVLNLMMMEMSINQIANTLNISCKSVYRTKRSLRQKIGDRINNILLK